jgi:crossover junction endodeoxyribonuclease RuvC
LKILAIDQSLNSTGTCVYLGVATPLIVNTIDPKKLRGVERLWFIRDAIIRSIQQYDIQLVILEEYGFAAVGRVFSLGEIGGILKLACYDLNVPHFPMPIGTHKMFSTGKGNTKKDMMLLEIFKRYGIEAKDDDQADAVSIAMTTLGYIDYKTSGANSKTGEKFTGKQLTALENLDNHFEKSDKKIKEFILGNLGK